jgi:hypothetical protein
MGNEYRINPIYENSLMRDGECFIKLENYCSLKVGDIEK